MKIKSNRGALIGLTFKDMLGKENLKWVCRNKRKILHYVLISYTYYIQKIILTLGCLSNRMYNCV